MQSSRSPSVRHMPVELAEALVPTFGIVVPSGRRLEACLMERHLRLRARFRKSDGNQSSMTNVSLAIFLRKAKNQSFWLNDFVKLSIFYVFATRVVAIFNPPLATRPSINFTECHSAVVGREPRPDVDRVDPIPKNKLSRRIEKVNDSDFIRTALFVILPCHRHAPSSAVWRVARPIAENG